jgi:hypothetical protein
MIELKALFPARSLLVKEPNRHERPNHKAGLTRRIRIMAPHRRFVNTDFPFFRERRPACNRSGRIRFCSWPGPAPKEIPA